MKYPFSLGEVAAVFGQFDPTAKSILLDVRDTIFTMAAELDQVETLAEDLKWGQPSYGTMPAVGTPIRLGVNKSGTPAMFVLCQTDLVNRFAATGWSLPTEGNRAVLLENVEVVRQPELLSFIGAAMTYHLK